MKTGIAAAAALVLLLTGCAPGDGPDLSGEDAAANFDGGILRVRYPNEGNKDILIWVNPDGSVAKVTGGATEVRDLRLSRAAIEFGTDAATITGPQPMEFALGAVDEGSYVGEYAVGGDCTKNCVRTGAANWDKGADRVALPDT